MLGMQALYVALILGPEDFGYERVDQPDSPSEGWHRPNL